MHCRCGNPKILAVGLCATCYTLKRQDEEYFGGLREAVCSVMAIDAACAANLEAGSEVSPFITALPASLSWT